MSTDRPCCRSAAHPALRRAGRWAPGHAVGWGIAALLLPKCPACVAGYLSVLGVGLGVGTAIGGVLRPACIVLAVVATALSLTRRLRRSTLGAPG